MAIPRRLTVERTCDYLSNSYPRHPFRGKRKVRVGFDSSNAEVVELVDAPDSKSGVRKDVWVRFPPSALVRGPLKSGPFLRGCHQGHGLVRCPANENPSKLTRNNLWTETIGPSGAWRS